MNWTDERVELLRKLWAEGLSASQIATQLGGVSRNAVIGKVHRLKLSGRGRATAAQPRAKKVAPAAAPVKVQTRPAARTITATVGATALAAQFDAEPVVHQVLRPIEDVVVPISRNLSLIELTERTCKWPNGDPLHDDFSFCGNQSGESSPYCGYHAKLAYQPASERRRAR
ncbi:GcrA family cell cycle regulator [Aquamicrobium zhengzhouense]|uniref:GcrA family cell cycle regulator n=1 Tax=Aquamicrobium zhengzhouense TaxID=2781738 RepID=A0ABS0SCM1_9HYPH|nr:GcrA family cell cycle regulator [Aquamicrobium zhengzhouense]MBI1621050.1 GcrA family cell cycle regulator [Aquamicrobium zhengzhouense]